MGIGFRIGLFAVALGVWPLAALAQSDSTVSTAVAIVRPSVVAIETRFNTPVIKDEYYFWQAMRGARPLYGLWGSGFIYKDPRYVITTSFLMEDAEHIAVRLDDGRSYRAELVGTNEALDVAVLRVDWGPDLEPISPPIGDSEALKLGQPIAIVGKALNSVDTYTSFGVISAIRKEVPGTDKPTDEFLQFDASYELSFVGAPLVDVHGNVVAMVDQTVQDFSLTNINLAVPINEVIFIADRIIAGQDITTWFGVERTAVNHSIISKRWAPAEYDWNGDGTAETLDFGMFVTYVEPLSPADIAGIKANDVIIELDTQRIKYDYDWSSYVRNFNIGQIVTVKYLRNHGTMDAPEWRRMETQVQVLAKAEDDEDDEDGESGSNSSGGSSYHNFKSAGANRNSIFAPRSR